MIIRGEPGWLAIEGRESMLFRQTGQAVSVRFFADFKNLFSQPAEIAECQQRSAFRSADNCVRSFLIAIGFTIVNLFISGSRYPSIESARHGRCLHDTRSDYLLRHPDCRNGSRADCRTAGRNFLGLLSRRTDDSLVGRGRLNLRVERQC